MKRLFTCLLLAVVTFVSVVPAEAARVRVRRGPHGRTVVTVRAGHPIHRARHTVIVRRPGVVRRVAVASFLPVVVWAPVVVARPDRDVMVWQDAETLFKEEDWAETVFDADARGEKLFLEVVAGKVQFDYAEVTFENGECQVVDLGNGTRGPGVYSLLDFRDGRKIDHVSLTARARTSEARIALLLRK